MDAYVQAIDFVTPDKGWLATQQSLLVTNDGGFSWLPIDTSALATSSNTAPPSFAELQFIDASDGWGIYGQEIVATSDGGHTWTRLNSPCPSKIGIAAISVIDALSAWAVCGLVPGAGNQLKRLFRTSDGGVNWQIVSGSWLSSDPPPKPGSIPAFGYVNGLSFEGEFSGWMTTSRGGLYATDDGGLSWRHIDTGLYCADWFPEHPLLLSNVAYVADYCGDRGVLLNTSDIGETWSRLYPPPFLEGCAKGRDSAYPRGSC